MVTSNFNHLISRIERLTNKRVEFVKQVLGGYTAATRLVCKTENSSFFAKIGSTDQTSKFLRREYSVYERIQAPFMPQLIAWEDHESEPILIIEDLSSQDWPPPWDEKRLNLVLEQIEKMHETPVFLEPYAEVHKEFGTGWKNIAASPDAFLSLKLTDRHWLDAALPVLQKYEGQCRTEGNCLTHWDLRSDNICLAQGRVIFIDWNLACLSNPELDLGFLLPSLAFEGGPEPDKILPDAPEVAAWVSGYFASLAGLPEVPNAPRVRLVQRQQLQTALPWAMRALDLQPPASV